MNFKKKKKTELGFFTFNLSTTSTSTALIYFLSIPKMMKTIKEHIQQNTVHYFCLKVKRPKEGRKGKKERFH